MNRIILIGNGFDRAHGLATSYKHFIDWFWKEQAKELRKEIAVKGKIKYENDFISFSILNEYGVYRDDLKLFLSDIDLIRSYKDLVDAINNFIREYAQFKVRFVVQAVFLKYITLHSTLEKWVDIEEAYHLFLNAISRSENITYKKKTYKYENVNDLHSDFENIRKALEEYLIEIIKKATPKIEGIEDIIYSDFKIDDFVSEAQKTLEEELNKVNSRSHSGPYTSEDAFERKTRYTFKELTSRPVNNILFLNFNYTNLEKLYNKKGIETIHIHGELDNPDNKMIFGYGDELCDEYKELERLNDNDYLENIKSIKYLETDNYKRLLSFVESEEYQIFIFGHSCGNSDRTLLNTLFEHKNCVSIKVFYAEALDNYSDIVRNISRNFNDKASFRSKVVNKEYCQPLPQANKSSSED